MSNITSELKKQRSAFEKELATTEAVKQVKLLENQSAQEDLRIATALGAKNSISRALEKRVTS